MRYTQESLSAQLERAQHVFEQQRVLVWRLKRHRSAALAEAVLCNFIRAYGLMARTRDNSVAETRDRSAFATLPRVYAYPSPEVAGDDHEDDTGPAVRVLRGEERMLRDLADHQTGEIRHLAIALADHCAATARSLMADGEQRNRPAFRGEASALAGPA